MTIIKNNFGIKMRTHTEIFLSAQFYCSLSCSVQMLTVTYDLQLKDPLFKKIRKPLQFMKC